MTTRTPFASSLSERLAKAAPTLREFEAYTKIAHGWRDLQKKAEDGNKRGA